MNKSFKQSKKYVGFCDVCGVEPEKCDGRVSSDPRYVIVHLYPKDGQVAIGYSQTTIKKMSDHIKQRDLKTSKKFEQKKTKELTILGLQQKIRNMELQLKSLQQPKENLTESKAPLTISELQHDIKNKLLQNQEKLLQETQQLTDDK